MFSFISNIAFDYFFTIPILVAIPFALALAGIAFLKDS